MAVISVDYFRSSVDANTVYKNSGILRYAFGVGSGITTGRLGGGEGFVAVCLGDASETTPDVDNQLFGMSSGHPIVGGSPGSIFASVTNLAQKNAQAIGPGGGIRFPPNAPNAGTATGQARTAANGRLPSGTKVYAWFAMAVETTAASTVPGEAPLPLVQVEVTQNPLYAGGVLTDANGEQFIGAIRAGIFNAGDSNSLMGGVLYVRVEHSFEDLPGRTAQSILPIVD